MPNDQRIAADFFDPTKPPPPTISPPPQPPLIPSANILMSSGQLFAPPISAALLTAASSSVAQNSTFFTPVYATTSSTIPTVTFSANHGYVHQASSAIGNPMKQINSTYLSKPNYSTKVDSGNVLRGKLPNARNSQGNNKTRTAANNRPTINMDLIMVIIGYIKFINFFKIESTASANSGNFEKESSDEIG